MKKTLLSAAVLIGLVALVKRFGPKMQNMDWETRFAQMPDNFPPKWMFHNIATIRQNTDRILELIDTDSVNSAQPATAAT
jgi:hypothetical protein